MLPRSALATLLVWVSCVTQGAAAQGADPDPAAIEVYVWGQQPTSAATEQTRWARDLELRPSNTPTDVLELVPGLVIGQHHGGGKADQILFRGFDSDHGTDFAIFIDGIPVNMVSHAHGQGYADVHWLIPETIERVEIYKGPYFAHLGDFATSGAMNIITKSRDKDSTLTLSGGSYNTQRYVGIFSPPESTLLRPYIAGEFYHNDGPFKSENNYNRYNILAKLGLVSTANSNLSLLGTFFKTAWDASGEVPARAVRSGEIGRFDSFDPSEGGKSERQNLSLIYNYADANQSFTAQTWASWYKLRLWSNFTLFLNDPVNGDGIEQSDKRFLIGNNIHYRRNYTLFGLPMETFAGFQSRFDHIRVGLFSQRNRRRVVKAGNVSATLSNNNVAQTNLGWFAQQEIRPTFWLRTQLGVRLDNFWYSVDQVGNPANVVNPVSGDGSASIANPKLNFIFTPFNDTPFAKGTNLFINFGGGFHSNDARVFVRDPKKEIPRFWGGEIGAKSRVFGRLDISFAYWRSQLESELVFVGDEATFEPSGRSRRHGVESEIRYDVLPWLSYDLDFSYTWAKFVNGDAVPLAPRLVTYSGLTARHPSGIQARLQMRYIGSRYAIEDRTIKTPPATIFDLFLKYLWQRYEFFVTFENLGNVNWRSAEHAFVSRLPTEPAAGVLGSHFTPGDPFTAKAGVTIHFW
ncbi:MAG TPA: TonB-dependent receptor plug domain-containing protein [Candidatus Eisenbacteria bacterium]|nr:TonB-dependent receptor plug domain-containing protein [Candidatus Eisenbacteria bacterium]